jgi:hypothetical protein
MNAPRSGTSKSRGRPRTGQGIQIGMRWPLELLAEIDTWAAAQPDEPSRSEAILRLVRGALAASADKQPETPASGLTDTPKAEGAGSPTAATPTLPQQPHQGDTERINVDGERPRREVKWTLRVVEATPEQAPDAQVSPVAISAPATEVPATAQSFTTPVEDDKPYHMPEDIKAFDEYWKRAEHMLGRHLEYEEVVVSYNRYRDVFENLSDHED